MHVYFSSLFLGLVGLLLGTVLGRNHPDLPAHFGQRLRERSAISVSVEQKRSIRQRLQRLASDRLHLAAPKRPFPTLHPVSAVPNWGAMQKPSLWSRSYDTLSSNEFIPVPTYDLPVLTFPMRALDAKNPDDIPLITAKLYYSTRFFGRYDLDAGEFTGPHVGVDLKLPPGTPIGAIADGIVHAVQRDDRLGLSVIIRHRHPLEGILFSIYGHLGKTVVESGQWVDAGDRIGTVGTSGRTSGPHLHLQIDRPQKSGGMHTPFLIYAVPSPRDIEQWTLHPIRFIEEN